MSRGRILIVTAIALAASAGLAAGGKGKQIRYVGVHPIVKAHGGGLCHIEAPHVHVYAPAEPVQYRDHDGAHFFVGDPVAYGWDGDRTTYVGHHPIHADVVVDLAAAPGEPVFCYIDGAHFHTFAPPPVIAADWKVAGNAYFYVGTPPPVYVEARPKHARINAIYQPIEYERPVVVVDPPAAWIGVRFAAPVVVVDEPPPPPHGDVEIVVPAGVQVDVRPPSLSVGVDIGIGGGVVIGDGHGHGHGHHKGKHKGPKPKPKKGKLKGATGPWFKR
jgi:hypothetical protein